MPLVSREGQDGRRLWVNEAFFNFCAIEYTQRGGNVLGRMLIEDALIEDALIEGVMVTD